MSNFDPKLLRQLAATYRERAEAEPRLTRVFLEIANDMEADARRIEVIERDGPSQKMRPANGSLEAERIRHVHKLSEDRNAIPARDRLKNASGDRSEMRPFKPDFITKGSWLPNA